MKKVNKRGESVVHISPLKRKISGMTFVNLNILALNYGRRMEILAVNTYADYIKNYHQDYII